MVWILELCGSSSWPQSQSASQNMRPLRQHLYASIKPTLLSANEQRFILCFKKVFKNAQFMHTLKSYFILCPSCLVKSLLRLCSNSSSYFHVLQCFISTLQTPGGNHLIHDLFFRVEYELKRFFVCISQKLLFVLFWPGMCNICSENVSNI